MSVLGIWAVSVVAGVLCGALTRRSKWWVGLILTVALGPLGLVLLAVDVATWRPASADLDARSGRGLR